MKRVTLIPLLFLHVQAWEVEPATKDKLTAYKYVEEGQQLAQEAIPLDSNTYQQWNSLEAMLNQLPSVCAISSFYGGNTSLFVRGANSNHNAVFLNKRSFPSGFANDFNFSHFPIFDSDSVLLKTDIQSPIGGTLEITTGPASFNEVGIEGGSFGFHREHVNFSKTTPTSQFHLWLSETQTQNVDPHNAYKGRSFWAHWRRIKDAYTYELLSYGYYEQIELPGPRVSGFPRLADYQDRQTYLISPGLQISAEKRYRLFAHYAFSLDSMDSLASNNLVQNETFNHEAFAAFKWKGQTLATSTSLRALSQCLQQSQPTSFDTTWNSLHAQQSCTWKGDLLQIKANTGAFRHSQFSSDWSCGLRAEVTLGSWTPFASFARSIHYPTPNDFLYSQSHSLKTEKAYRSQMGIKIALNDTLQLSLCGFYNVLFDLIECDPFPPYDTYNVAKANIYGLESSLVLKKEALNAYLNCTYWHAYAKDGLGVYQNGNRLLRRPKYKLTTGAQYAFTRALSAGIDLSFRKDIIDIDPSTYQRISGDDTLTLRIYTTYFITPELLLSAHVENLLNDKYQEIRGYNSLPLQAYVGIKYRF